MAIETVTAIVYKDGKPKNSLVPTLQCLRLSDRKYLDWNDGVFKSSGWTTLETPMTNINNGIYYKDVDRSTWGTEEYLFIVDGITADNLPQYGVLSLRATTSTEVTALSTTALQAIDDQLDEEHTWGGQAV